MPTPNEKLANALEAAKRASGYSAIGYTIAQGPGLFDG